MWPNPQETADLVIFTEEILNGKLHFLCNDLCNSATQPIISPKFYRTNSSEMFKVKTAEKSFDKLIYVTLHLQKKPQLLRRQLLQILKNRQLKIPRQLKQPPLLLIHLKIYLEKQQAWNFNLMNHLLFLGLSYSFWESLFKKVS